MDKHENIGSTDSLEEVYKCMGLTKHEFTNEFPELLPAFQYLERTEYRMPRVFDPENAKDVLKLLQGLENDEKVAQEFLQVNEKVIEERNKQIADLMQKVDEIQKEIEDKQKEIQELSSSLKPREDVRDQFTFRARLVRNYCVCKGFIKIDLAEKESENEKQVEKKSEKKMSKKARKKAQRKARRNVEKYATQNDEAEYQDSDEYKSQYGNYEISDRPHWCYYDSSMSDDLFIP